MNENTIGFIGGGNMATSLICGLIAGGYNKKRIWVSDPETEKIAQLGKTFGVNTTKINPEVVEKAQILVLAVKPQNLHAVTTDISNTIQKLKPLIVSIVAGIRENDLERWCGGSISLVRCMPNTAALVSAGAIGLHANSKVTQQQRDIAESIMRSVGLTVWLKSEALLDTVTALSGSGPAYFFLLMEAIELAALELGLDQETARLLTQQTAYGAAKLSLEVDESPAELRRKVTSPGGTTEHAIEVFELGALRQLVKNALKAAKKRSIELSNELGGK